MLTLLTTQKVLLPVGEAPRATAQVCLARHASESHGARVVYTPVQQVTRSGMTLVVRTRAEPSGLQAAVNEAIWTVNPDQTIENVVTLDLTPRGRAAGAPRSGRRRISRRAALKPDRCG